MNQDQIRHGMEVVASDGVAIGVVDGVEGSSIKLQKDHSSDGRHHFVPLDLVSSVDSRVHLSVGAAAARERLALAPGAAAAAGAGTHHAAATAASGGRNWLPWVLGGLALLLLLIFGLRGCGRDDNNGELVATDQAEATNAAVAPVGSAGGVPISQEVGTYLAGTDPAPRTFPFTNLHFDTGSAVIREADKPELAALAKALVAHPQARADIVGYADAQGQTGSNNTLAQQRAQAVAQALIAQGVSAGALKPRGQGEANVAGADQEARRVELVITSR